MAYVIAVGIALLLLVLFPRWMIPILVTFGVALGGFIFWEEQKSAEETRKKASVTATAEFDAKTCADGPPINVTISNKSDETVILYRFGLDGYRTGHSKPIYTSGFRAYQTDRIIEPGQSWSKCWPVPKLAYDAPKDAPESFPPDTVDWRATDTDPTFQKR